MKLPIMMKNMFDGLTSGKFLCNYLMVIIVAFSIILVMLQDNEKRVDSFTQIVPVLTPLFMTWMGVIFGGRFVDTHYSKRNVNQEPESQGDDISPAGTRGKP